MTRYGRRMVWIGGKRVKRTIFLDKDGKPYINMRRTSGIGQSKWVNTRKQYVRKTGRLGGGFSPCSKKNAPVYRR